MNFSSRQKPIADCRLPIAFRRRSGLTAIELVSALALFVIIFGLLLVALNAATNNWTRSADKNRNLQKARQALDLIATDLACAVAPRSADANTTENSATLGAAQKPVFIAEQTVDQVGLYFIKLCSPVELTDTRQLSLDLVAYSWTTNGLSRYTRPVQTETDSPTITAPDLYDQLNTFKNAVVSTQPPTNILSSAIVGFAPLLYQPLKTTQSAANAATIDIGQDIGSNAEIHLADLPDFVDILIAYVNPDDWASGYSKTNYMTRRITLPAAQASRLP